MSLMNFEIQFYLHIIGILLLVILLLAWGTPRRSSWHMIVGGGYFPQQKDRIQDWGINSGRGNSFGNAISGGYSPPKPGGDMVATQRARIEVDVPGPGGRGWRRTGSQIDTQDDLDDTWRRQLSDGTRHLQEETWVPANDPHYDARVFPCVHPYSTGSLLAEVGSGGTQRFSRNRLMLIESWFRRSALWGFWSLNRLIQTELFFKNRKRQAAGRQGASATNDPDHIVRLFGTAQPSDIPESTEWWKRQQRDLFAITDEAEQGLMSAMVTVTMNDSCPEMLASIRRGPMAQPTDEEMIEYLLQRKRRDQERPAFENHSLEHVIAFQRRVQSLKDNFMRRGSRTPLGIAKDWWDRGWAIVMFRFMCAQHHFEVQSKTN